MSSEVHPGFLPSSFRSQEYLLWAHSGSDGLDAKAIRSNHRSTGESARCRSGLFDRLVDHLSDAIPAQWARGFGFMFDALVNQICCFSDDRLVGDGLVDRHDVEVRARGEFQPHADPLIHANGSGDRFRGRKTGICQRSCADHRLD